MIEKLEKLEKIALAKAPKTVPKKRNFDQNINDSKSPTWKYFFENAISGMFSTRKSQSQQKLAKGSHILQYRFARKTSLIL